MWSDHMQGNTYLFRNGSSATSQSKGGEVKWAVFMEAKLESATLGLCFVWTARHWQLAFFPPAFGDLTPVK